MSSKNNIFVISGNGVKLFSVIMGTSFFAVYCKYNLTKIYYSPWRYFLLNKRHKEKKKEYERVGEETIRREGATLDNKNI